MGAKLRELRDYDLPMAELTNFRKEKHNILNNDFCIHLKKKHPELLNMYMASDIRKIFSNFSRHGLIEYITTNREPVELPHKMADMFLGVFGKWYNGVDHVKSADVGKEVHYRNNHSDTYGARIFYSISRVQGNTKNYTTKHMWGFDPTNYGKKKIEEAMKGDNANWKKFIYVRNAKFVGNIIKKALIKESSTMNLDIHENYYGEYNPLSMD